MDDHRKVASGAYGQRERLHTMRHIGTAGLERLRGELARAEAACDARRARVLLADIQTIELWLAWVAREEWRIATRPTV